MSILYRVGRFIVPALIVFGVLALSAGPASATETTDPPTYRIGLWTCQAVESDPMRNPCVLSPDPAGDPVAFEPDNSPIPASEVYASILPDPDSAKEDEPGFDCRTDGNGVCGPGAEYPAGCYNRNTGAFVAPWQESWRGVWRPRECGRPTARDLAQQARLNGEVGQLCAGTQSGTGRVCWYVDQPRPRVAHGPAEYVAAA